MIALRPLDRAMMLFMLFVTALQTSNGQDWPSFRGIRGSGVADGFPIRTQWDADPSSDKLSGISWQQKLPGLGHSSPVITGNKIFVTTAIASSGKSPLVVGAGGRPEAADDQGEQSWVLLCFDKQTGNELWRQTAKKGRPRATRHAKATHANASVTVEGDRVVAFFGSEGLYCFDLDGKLKWKRDLGVIDISKYGIGWGFASSPALFQDQIVIVCDDPKNPFIASLRLSDGKEKWRVSRMGVCERSWGTPFIFRSGGRTQVVVNGWPWVMSYDLETGKEIWKIRGGGDNPVPTPFASNNWIYVTSAHGGQSPIYVVKPEAIGDITPSKDGSSGNKSIVWSTLRGGSYMSTPVVYRDLLYLGNSNGTVRCFDAKTGEPVYQKRLAVGAGIIASLVAADGKIFCASENGIVYVLEAGREFKILARNNMGSPCFASPAISDGVIYFRTTEKLIAISKPTEK